MRTMSIDSLSSFSSSSEDEDDIEIIQQADIAEAITGIVSPLAVPTFSSSDSKNNKKVSEKSVNSCTVTGDDPKETVDSADSGSRLNKISANKTENNNNNTKRAATRKMPPFYYFIPLYILFYLMIATPFLGTFDDLLLRSFLHGPTEIRVQKVTLSAFSSASWRSREINVQGTMNLEFENVLISQNIFYNPIQVLISSNGADLSFDTLTPFAQPPRSKSEVKVTFSSTIDATAIEEFIAPNDVVSLNVSVFTGVTEEKNAKWSVRLFCKCSDVRLQFFQGSDVAEMVNRKPVLCKCESDDHRRTIPEISDSKFHDVMNKIRGIVEVFYQSS